MDEWKSRALTRREAVTLLGVGAACGLLPARLEHTVFAASPQSSAARSAFPRGAVVRTVLSDVAPSRITGATLIHEHLSSKADFYRDLDLMTDEVRACAKNGVGCIVDTGHPDLGRSIDDLRTIARRSGMLIVAGGGLHSKGLYPADVFQKSEEPLAEDFYKLATAERWGVIGEIGTGTAVPMDRDERKVLRAVARLHRRTGLSIITHVSDGCAQCALDQIDVYEQAGVNLNQVVIGHLNDITDQPTVAPLAIAKRGAYLGFDHSGKPDDPRLQEYVRTIMTILEAGYVDNVCLSSDFGNGKYLRKNGGPGISMTMTHFVPRLRQAGVNDATVHKILVENPRRVLTFVPKV